MPHPSQDLLVSYVGGELDPAQADTVRAHLAGCEGCARIAREFGEVDGLLRRLPPLPLAPDFTARVTARALVSSPPRAWWRQAAAAIVLLAAGLGGGWTLARYTTPTAAPPIVRNSDGPKFAMIFAEAPTTLVGVTDEERRQRYDELMTWMQSIGDGIVRLGGSELDTASGGIVGASTPTPEAQLVLSGFIVVRATSYDDVARQAERCPIVRRGGQVIVRQLQ